jgi:putative ABC transport system substrate-binding protein
VAIVLGCAVTLLLTALATPILGAPVRIGVFISQEISPFLVTVQGLAEHLEVPVARTVLEKEGNAYRPRAASFAPDQCAVLVAVGPRALAYLAGQQVQPPVVYAMVLNPETVDRNRISVCGVSLNLPPGEQFSILRQTLPEVTRLGVLFDPANNQGWYTSARETAKEQGIALVPLVVSEMSEIADFFSDRKPDVDAILFIPDRTVISKAVIQYVIKEGILRGIPTIGYNAFFHEAGAALSFVIDYEEVGKRVAGQIDAVLAGRPCVPVGPPFRVRLNRKVVRTLGLTVKAPLPDRVEEVP